MMNIYCDDSSTNVKLAWFEGNELADPGFS